MKNLFKKAHKAIVLYAVAFAPVWTLYLGYWTMVKGEEVPQGFVNNMGFAWVLSLAYVVLALIFYRNFRETVVARLAGFKESDEREEIVTAHAARRTFLLTLAVQVVFLIMSITNIQVYRNLDGKGYLTVGMGFSSSQFDIYSLPTDSGLPSQGVLWGVGGHLIPSNMTVVFLLMIFVQIAAFRLFSCRHYEGENNLS